MEEEQQQLTKNQRRALRKEEARAAARALKNKKKIKSILIALVSVVVVVGLGWLIIGVVRRADANKPGELVSSQGNRHIELDDPHDSYNTTPPTSGPHAGTARWGSHTTQIPDESQIHNLEDGGVGVQYDCNKEEESCSNLIDQLLTAVAPYKPKVFVGPYKGIGNKIALTAWQRIDKFDEFDEQRIIDFIEEYVGVDHHVRK